MDDSETQDGFVEGPVRRGPGRPPKAHSRSAQDSRLNDSVIREEPEDDSDGLEEAYFEVFRDSLDQSLLPNLPKIPGYHTCWLSTSHPMDTVQRRIRMGYELIRHSECPDMGPTSRGTGEYADVIAVNEMVGAKIPLRLYNRYMSEVHHDKPFQQEAGLRSMVDQMRAQAERENIQVQEGNGMADLGKRAKPMPVFTE